MPTRRAVLGALAAVACARPRAGDSADTAAKAPVLPGDDTPLDPLPPSEDFYRVAISGFLPDAAWLAAWTLTLADDDGNEVVLTVDDLRALGAEVQERTLACIGGGSYRTTGNALWGARRLDDIFAAVEFAPDPRLTWLRIHGGDGYVTDLPRADLAAGLALAWEMNGAALPAEHGAPVRALVPGRFGMKNPKWITRIEVVEAFEPGVWESRGWSQDAEYLVQSWFVTPTYGDTLTTRGAWAKGIAFAGERGVSRVELSLDNGATWESAEITYAGGAGVWTLWRFELGVLSVGPLSLRVRATTLDGEVQAQTEDYDVDLDGLEAWDLAVVEVIEG